MNWLLCVGGFWIGYYIETGLLKILHKSDKVPPDIIEMNFASWILCWIWFCWKIIH